MSSRTSKVSNEKKRKHIPAEEEDFVRLDLFRFIDLHYHQLLYAEAMSDQSDECLQEAEKIQTGLTISKRLKNAAIYMKNTMAEVAQTSKYELERILEDKPNFRGKYYIEIRKIDEMIKKLIGQSLVWKVAATQSPQTDDDDNEL